jgi:DNA-binding NarL/FixJ family response regulator
MHMTTGNAGGTAAHGLRVVLVEDHPGYLDQLREMIHALEDVHVVHTADNDQDAVHWLAAHPGGWDLLVLDIFLARGHGFKVLQACGERRPDQRAVFLTSYTRDPARSQALALGADAVFHKVKVAQFLQYVTVQRDARVQHA